jgi:hypothetical protein
MTETICFNDKALDQAVRSSASKFANFQQYLNNLSSDIKSLEKWFQACSVCVLASVYVESGEDQKDRLSWSAKHGDWRILYETPSPDYGRDHEYEYDSIPLIETPIATRLRCASALPALVKELASMLPAMETEAAARPVATKKKSKVESEDLDAIFSSEDELPF